MIFQTGNVLDLEVIVVSDGLTARTAKIARGYAAREERVSMIELRTNRGYGAAICAMLNAWAKASTGVPRRYAVSACDRRCCLVLSSLSSIPDWLHGFFRSSGIAYRWAR
jgi:glycosyltransferase involved in cell wall biosynthesis